MAIKIVLLRFTIEFIIFVRLLVGIILSLSNINNSQNSFTGTSSHNKKIIKDPNTFQKPSLPRKNWVFGHWHQYFTWWCNELSIWNVVTGIFNHHFIATSSLAVFARVSLYSAKDADITRSLWVMAKERLPWHWITCDSGSFTSATWGLSTSLHFSSRSAHNDLPWQLERFLWSWSCDISVKFHTRCSVEMFIVAAIPQSVSKQINIAHNVGEKLAKSEPKGLCK